MIQAVGAVPRMIVRLLTGGDLHVTVRVDRGDIFGRKESLAIQRTAALVLEVCRAVSAVMYFFTLEDTVGTNDCL
jgi:hypothetical protein